jgi:predicted nucleotidyltransferase
LGRKVEVTSVTLADAKANETLHKVVQRIVEDYQPDKIILFGSYAYGQPRPESDLDLLIIKQSNERPIDRQIAVRTLLRPLKPRPVVSPLVVTQSEFQSRLTMGDPFAQEIDMRGRVIYERD